MGRFLTRHGPLSLGSGNRLLLHWQAHGFEYGLSIKLEEVLARSCSVVANVSRSVVPEARARLAPVIVVGVTASSDVLVARLRARGRETPAEIEQRLRRDVAWAATDADIVIENDGPLGDAVDAFVAGLRGCLESPTEIARQTVV